MKYIRAHIINFDYICIALFGKTAYSLNMTKLLYLLYK